MKNKNELTNLVFSIIEESDVKYKLINKFELKELNAFVIFLNEFHIVIYDNLIIFSPNMFIDNIYTSYNFYYLHKKLSELDNDIIIKLGEQFCYDENNEIIYGKDAEEYYDIYFEFKLYEEMIKMFYLNKLS